MYYSFWRPSYSEELYHFGVLGMKWGVRRFQNKDGTLTPKGKQRVQEIYEKRKAGIEEQRRTALADASKAKKEVGITEEKDYDVIAKGSSLNRFTTNKSEDQAKAAYVSATWDDKISYENDALEGLLGIAAPSSDWLSIELEAVSDLKVAKGKEVVNYILSNREASKEAADYLSNVEQHHAILSALYDEKNASIHEKSKHKIDEALFNVYDKGRIEARSLIVNSLYKDKDFRDKMFDHFKKKGYAAIEDIEDSNYMQNGRATPMIIIDPSSSVKVKQIYQVFDPETGDAYRPIKHSTIYGSTMNG